MTYGCSHRITYTRHNGSTYTKPLFATAPKVLFKDANTPLSILIRYVIHIVSLSIQYSLSASIVGHEPKSGFQTHTFLFISSFQCPFESCECQLSNDERLKHEKHGSALEPCPFRRRIRFADSILHIQSSLSALIDDLHISARTLETPVETAFSCSKSYCDSLGFSDEQFHQFISTKVNMPFEKMCSFDQMLATTSPPPPSDFKSILRGVDSISPSDHQIFCDMWTRFGCNNLVDIVQLYAVADVGKSLCIRLYFFYKAFSSHPSIHYLPTHTLTFFYFSSFIFSLVCRCRGFNI